MPNVAWRIVRRRSAKLCTLNGAKQIRPHHRIGSIDAGKDADLATAHPFNVRASDHARRWRSFDRSHLARATTGAGEADRLKKEADDEEEQEIKTGKTTTRRSRVARKTKASSRCSSRHQRSRSPSSSTVPVRRGCHPQRYDRPSPRPDPNGTIVFRMAHHGRRSDRPSPRMPPSSTAPAFSSIPACRRLSHVGPKRSAPFPAPSTLRSWATSTECAPRLR